MPIEQQRFVPIEQGACFDGCQVHCAWEVEWNSSGVVNQTVLAVMTGG